MSLATAHTVRHTTGIKTQSTARFHTQRGSLPPNPRLQASAAEQAETSCIRTAGCAAVRNTHCAQHIKPELHTPHLQAGAAEQAAPGRTCQRLAGLRQGGRGRRANIGKHVGASKWRDTMQGSQLSEMHRIMASHDVGIGTTMAALWKTKKNSLDATLKQATGCSTQHPPARSGYPQSPDQPQTEPLAHPPPPSPAARAPRRAATAAAAGPPWRAVLAWSVQTPPPEGRRE